VAVDLGSDDRPEHQRRLDDVPVELGTFLFASRSPVGEEELQLFDLSTVE
jgi:hypothetical protein